MEWCTSDDQGGNAFASSTHNRQWINELLMKIIDVYDTANKYINYIWIISWWQDYGLLWSVPAQYTHKQFPKSWWRCTQWIILIGDFKMKRDPPAPKPWIHKCIYKQNNYQQNLFAYFHTFFVHFSSFFFCHFSTEKWKRFVLQTQRENK